MEKLARFTKRLDETGMPLRNLWRELAEQVAPWAELVGRRACLLSTYRLIDKSPRSVRAGEVRQDSRRGTDLASARCHYIGIPIRAISAEPAGRSHETTLEGPG